MHEPKTFRMPKINYYVRKHFRTKVLVLDLDDTIMPWPRNMPLKNGKHLNLNAYVSNVFAKIASEVLGLDRDEAFELCSTGYFNYGSAIIGLLETPDYDVTEEQAHEIFMRVHQQTATNPSKGVVAWAKPNFKLHYLLSQFKTVPYIITHGSTPYAKIALECMGLLNTVVPEKNVFGLELYGYYNTKNKPNPYVWFQQKTGIPFNRMVMSEDSHKNLVFAKALGMKTVLLHREGEQGEPFPDYDYVDHTHQKLEDYLQMFLDKGVNYTEEKLERSLEELVSENSPYGAYYQKYIIDNAISA